MMGVMLRYMPVGFASQRSCLFVLVYQGKSWPTLPVLIILMVLNGRLLFLFP